jgi:hypothetical protein
MRQSIVLAGLVLLLAASGPAQGFVHIPDNQPGSGTCNAYPFSRTSFRFQMILASSFTPSAPIKITDIAFSPCTTMRSWTSKGFRVRMCHTSLKDFQGANDRCFDKNLCPCPTELYNGAIQWQLNPNNWSPMGMTCSFGHDGQRNILIDLVGLSNSGGVTCHRGNVIPRLWEFSNPPAPCGSTDGPTTQAGLKIRLTYSRTCVLLAPDTASLGAATPIQLVGAPAARAYQIAASLSQGPPIPIQNCKICLGLDNVLIYSVLFGAPIFNSYGGMVGPTGAATGKFVPPQVPALIGVCVYHAAIVVDSKQGVVCCSNSAGTRITK